MKKNFSISTVFGSKDIFILLGKVIEGISLDNIQAASLKVIEAEKSTIQFHSIGGKKSCQPEEEEEELFTCENDGCIDSFPTAKDLDDHRIIGQCHLKAERSIDAAISKYSSKLQTRDLDQYTIGCRSVSNPKNKILAKGWALKEERKCKRFSEKQKEFLEKKFKIGMVSGRKEDPVTVSEEMRRVKSCDGERLFSYDELLTAQQIASFFSRLCKKSKNLHSAVKETLFDSVHQEALDC